MPILLMAQGDPVAKDRLKRAIQARYGLRPPPLESALLVLRGRARVVVGPLPVWLPVQITARFAFPNAMRWDFTVSAAHVPVNRGANAYDGQHVHQRRMEATPGWKGLDEALAQSMQARLWAAAAVLLTPLGGPTVRLEAVEDHRLRASHTELGCTVDLMLRADASLEEAASLALNAERGQTQRFRLCCSAALKQVNELLLPAEISAYWDDTPAFRVQPVAAEANPALADALFRLES